MVDNPNVKTYMGESPNSIGVDMYNFDTIPLVGYFTCPGHLTDLLKPVCVYYKKNKITNNSENYRPFVKELC